MSDRDTMPHEDLRKKTEELIKKKKRPCWKTWSPDSSNGSRRNGKAFRFAMKQCISTLTEPFFIPISNTDWCQHGEQ